MSTFSKTNDYINVDTLPDEGRGMSYTYLANGKTRVKYYYRDKNGLSTHKQKVIDSRKITDIAKARIELEESTRSLKSTTFKDCVEHYEKSHPGYNSYIYRLKIAVGNTVIDDNFSVEYLNFITRLETEPYKKKMRSVATISKYKAYTRAILMFCYNMGIIEKMPIRKFNVKPGDERDRILNPDEKLKLLNTLQRNESYLYWPVYFSLTNPIRRGDLVKLTRENWEPFENWVSFYASKTRKKQNRPTYLTEIDEPLIDYLNSIPPGNLLFPLTSFKTHWATMLRQANIKHFQFRDLKHCAITHMMDSNYTRDMLKGQGIQFTDKMIDLYRKYDIRKELDKLKIRCQEDCRNENEKNSVRV